MSQPCIPPLFNFLRCLFTFLDPNVCVSVCMYEWGGALGGRGRGGS